MICIRIFIQRHGGTLIPLIDINFDDLHLHPIENKKCNIIASEFNYDIISDEDHMDIGSSGVINHQDRTNKYISMPYEKYLFYNLDKFTFNNYYQFYFSGGDKDTLKARLNSKSTLEEFRFRIESHQVDYKVKIGTPTAAMPKFHFLKRSRLKALYHSEESWLKHSKPDDTLY